MKYTKGQFTVEYYLLWQMGLLLPTPQSATVYSVKYRKNDFDEYSRVTLKAVSVSDALERACYAITYASAWRPEDIDLHAVYDDQENLLWIDEPFYHLVQKKNEFRGMERREFLKRFGATSAAILYGLQPSVAHGIIPFGFFRKPKPTSGDQLYTSAGTYTYTVPSGVTNICFICVGGGGGGGTGALGIFKGSGGGAGGALVYKNSYSVTPNSTSSIVVGAGGAGVDPGVAPINGASTSIFGAIAGGGSAGKTANSGQVACGAQKYFVT